MAWKRFIAAGDIHGDQQDPKANAALFKFMETWKPHYRICAGDLWNFVALRRGASKEEQEESLERDYLAGMAWLKRFEASSLLLGNHDYRLWHLREVGKGVQKDYATSAVSLIEKECASLRCPVLPYDRRAGVLRLGNLKVIHGFVAGVNAARRSAQAYGSVLCFHGHGIQHVSIEGVENRMGRMCGCLCNLDMDYVHASLGSLTWRLGFAYGVIDDKTGRFHVWQAEEIEGVWVLPSDIVTLRG